MHLARTVLAIAACLLTLLAAPLAAICGAWRTSLAAPVGAVASLLAASLFAAAWALGEGGTILDVAWLPPPLNARLAFTLDGLGALYAVLVTFLGALVVAYTRGYLPAHLAKRERDGRGEVRFVALLLTFMAAMVSLVLAQDMVLLFVALDLTALLSFLLIRFDAPDGKAERAALLAIFVTAGTSPLYLVGALLLWREAGTTSLPALFASGAAPSSLAGGLLLAGVIAKSAQVPLQFWLRRAMVAPTPVSAFLHSAAMVAAGVIVLQRVRPLLEGPPWLLPLIVGIGLTSIVIGSVGALVRDELKAVLAASTVAQYGHIMVLIGVGGDAGVAGAALYLCAHGFAKAALFLTAGAVTEMTGKERLSELGGLFARAPLLGGASLVAALALAGAPLTLGYFKDELFFEAAWGHSPALGGGATILIALTVAYSLRFWTRIFLGRARTEHERHPLSRLLTVPIVVLALLVFALALWPAGVSVVVASAAVDVVQRPVSVHLAYAFTGAATLSAALAWLIGVALFLTERSLEQRSTFSLGRLRALAPPIVRPLSRGLTSLSDLGHAMEVRDLRDRIGFVLVPTAALLALAAFYSTAPFRLRLGALVVADVPTALALVVAAGASIAAASVGFHIGVVLMLSFVGFSLAFVFSASAAPDVALVAVLIETVFTLLFMTVLSRVPAEELRAVRVRAQTLVWRHLVIALIAASGSLGLTWWVLSSSTRRELPLLYLKLGHEAHAKDVVTAILADFRGYDTLGEITVLAVAAAGAVALSWGRRP